MRIFNTSVLIGSACMKSCLNLANRRSIPTNAYPGIFASVRAQFKEWLPKVKAMEPDVWKKDPHRFVELNAAGLLRRVATKHVLLADREAFETDRLRLIYLDRKRNIIWKTCVDADEQTITDIIMSWFELADPLEMQEGTTGERYRVTGDLGRE
ncbi:uncharacterized protein BDW43DRAFT_309544 [Aspergillus alliaceus]|uniref:uncharacterized protein n=1 Tax=Petromyces alliaceus TaxID=209559 RepID=UPI0012A3EBEF|nr:uncharacterized protein BDW43DRAFT_309544 [Aspergillus alliaceus]KAB8235170.1 hypothetical protein BDW43DRAFT_309544 [Aspergillus alliaceus]